MTRTTVDDVELSQLFPGTTTASLDVPGLATHSADVVAGGLFLACAGRAQHGLAHLGEALRRGARAVAWEPAADVVPPRLPAGVLGLQVPELSRQLGALGNRFYASPSTGLAVTGITGTNGKTTVAWLLVQALEALGRRAAYMGTLGHGLGTHVAPAELTTPGCIAVHRTLREFLDAGARHAAIEVSSHALDQGRVDGVAFRVAAFTNLSRDHLDYHGDLASYGRAKARLFLETGAPLAVINVADAFGEALARQLPAGMQLTSVAASTSDAACAPATVRAWRTGGDARGERLRLSIAGEEGDLVSPLVGDFNVENLAVVAGILHAHGMGAAAVIEALVQCRPPPGRMERIAGRPGSPQVIVDFAHTPDALRRVLSAARALGNGKLWCVFGCGGERDAGKRPLMGAVARELADRLVITDDNPRGEDPQAIIAAILQGAGAGGARVEVVRDREQAIRHAIGAAATGDVVVIAGKGHETVQIVGTQRHSFSDQAVASRALAERT